MRNAMSDRVLGARGSAVMDLLDDDMRDALEDLLGSLFQCLACQRPTKLSRMRWFFVILRQRFEYSRADYVV